MNRRLQALGRLPAGVENRMELRYRAELELRKRAGEILEFWFEGFKFRLADNCFYTPDYVVQLPNGELECHEVKGFWTDDARVKAKVFVDRYPFRLMIVTSRKAKDGGGFLVEEL